MSEERKAKIRRVMEEVYNKGNVEAMDDLYDANITRSASPLPALDGIEAYKQGVASLFDIYSDIQVAVDDVICEGDTCTARFTLQLTHTGYHPLADLEPTGKRVTLTACNVSQWVNGQIVKEWTYADYLGLFQQLGAAPPLGQG